MRIIAGEFRGRPLLAPDGDVTRPITDRVKQSLFDILSPNIEGSVVLDLFSGTGSMGLESLSRGARQANFFESDRSAVERLNRNLQTLHLAKPRAVIYPQDIFIWFNRWESRIERGGSLEKEQAKARLVFLDPPYRFLRERPHDLQKLSVQLTAFALDPDSITVFRHDANDSLELPSLRPYDVRTYGGMTLEFLTPATTI